MKEHPTIGCCGIDCALCPRYHIKGSSKCPGCFGPDFLCKHPGCSIITCCVKRNGLETCSECGDFPCSKLEGFDSVDSFVTHRRSLSNLELIRQMGPSGFLKVQKRRVRLLEGMLNGFDDGRSKGFYCLSAALLPVQGLEEALRQVSSGLEHIDKNGKAALFRKALNKIADQEGIKLSLDKKGRC